MDRSGAVQQGRLEDVLGDRLHGRREQHHVETHAAPDRDQQQPPQHRGYPQEGLRVGGERDRVLRIDDAELDEQVVDQALPVAPVDLLPHHGDDDQRQYLGEEEDDLVEARPPDTLHAGPVPPSAHVEQEREEQNHGGVARHFEPLVAGGVAGENSDEADEHAEMPELRADGDEPGPVTAFGFAKLTAERMLRVFAPASTATILRYASVYGPYEPERRAIPRLIRDALAGTPLLLDSDGSEERDYLHVCDAAAATIAAVDREADGAYDIGTGMATRTLDLARTIGELAGAKARPVSRAPVEGESRPPRLVAATRRAQEELGFAARRHLVDGLKEEIGWIRSQPAPKVGVALAATA